MCYLSLFYHLTLNGGKCRQGADRTVCRKADTSNAIPPWPVRVESAHSTTPPRAPRPARPAPTRPARPHRPLSGSRFPILGRPLVCLRHSHSWVGAYLRLGGDLGGAWSLLRPFLTAASRCRALPAVSLAAPRTRGQPAKDEGEPAEDEGVPRAQSSHFFYGIHMHVADTPLIILIHRLLMTFQVIFFFYVLCVSPCGAVSSFP